MRTQVLPLGTKVTGPAAGVAASPGSTFSSYVSSLTTLKSELSSLRYSHRRSWNRTPIAICWPQFLTLKP